MEALAARCHACGSTSIRIHPPSHRTGFVIHSCRDCGLHELGSRPPVEEMRELLDADLDVYEGFMGRARVDLLADVHEAMLQRLETLVDPADKPKVFDIGAGAGGFLSRAREHGFQPGGNDLSSGAIALTKREHDIDLLLGDLSELEVEEQDVVTMWCVLAHVDDGPQLLSNSLDVLRPGGVLYLQTPRWSLMDRVGMALHDLTRGRFSRITDRRIALHHMALHTAKSMRALLERLGFDVVAIEPRVRYGLKTADYLQSLGLGPTWARRVARPLEWLVDRNLFFRNVFDVYARRPRTS